MCSEPVQTLHNQEHNLAENIVETKGFL
jgi:hypothetical protein